MRTENKLDDQNNKYTQLKIKPAKVKKSNNSV